MLILAGWLPWKHFQWRCEWEICGTSRCCSGNTILIWQSTALWRVAGVQKEKWLTLYTDGWEETSQKNREGAPESEVYSECFPIGARLNRKTVAYGEWICPESKAAWWMVLKRRKLTRGLSMKAGNTSAAAMCATNTRRVFIYIYIASRSGFGCVESSSRWRRGSDAAVKHYFIFFLHRVFVAKCRQLCRARIDKCATRATSTTKRRFI